LNRDGDSESPFTASAGILDFDVLPGSLAGEKENRKQAPTPN